MAEVWSGYHVSATSKDVFFHKESIDILYDYQLVGVNPKVVQKPDFGMTQNRDSRSVRGRLPS